LISLERRINRNQLFGESKKSMSVFISTVTLFELQCGSTKTKQHTEDIHRLRKWIETIPFDENISEISAIIFQYLRAKNQLIEFRDFFIAATALSQNFLLATFNLNHFIRIQSLRLLNIKSY
jgi:predicted nucleic acid-binding protein